MSEKYLKVVATISGILASFAGLCTGIIEVHMPATNAPIISWTDLFMALAIGFLGGAGGRLGSAFVGKVWPRLKEKVRSRRKSKTTHP
jgi:ABC-type branched-subunit amino acid transport system permease subunit